MVEPAKHDCEAWLSHAGWVRALARQLTADAHLADDLAQDALVAAFADPRPSGQALHSWLAAVLRNLARRERRTRGNRGARERSVARAEADLSHEQLLERLDTHRSVVDAVARLDEPYRAAILMRYFEDLPPAAIAARTGTPLRTVHTRLHRALARLREDLDRAHGSDRRTWLLALIPFARGSERWSGAAIGALVMDAKLKVALAAAAVAGVCATWLLWPSGAARDANAVSAAPSEIAPELPTTSEMPAPAEERAAVEQPARELEVAAAEPAPVAAAPARLSGRVIDLDRAPVAGVRVGFFDATQRAKDGSSAETDALGAFAFDDPRSTGYLDVDDRRWISVFRPEFKRLPDAGEYVLVVAPRVVLAGAVVDEQRRPIAAAKVGVALPFGLRAQFDTILDNSSTVDIDVRTDDAGRFELVAPLVPTAWLTTAHASYLADRRALPQLDEVALEIVLRAAQGRPEYLVGRVVDAAGDPVEGAWVALDVESTKSGAGGEFALTLRERTERDFELAGVSKSAPLRAVKAGFLPAELERPADGVWPKPVILRLGEPSLAISGRVVDAGSRPVRNATVWASDETRFGFVEIESGEMSMRAGATIEGLLRGDPWTPRITTKSDGRFEIAGLVPRDYRVVALDTQRLAVVETSVAAGARDVELVIPSEPLHERVAGRVTNLAGEPLAGVYVLLERSAGDASSPLHRLSSGAVETDAEGRFAFTNVARAAATLRVSGGELGLNGIEFRVASDADVGDLRVAVPTRVHVQVEGTEPLDYDRVALLDEKGEALELSLYHGNSAYSMRDISLHEGRTEPFSVAESAKTLVLRMGEVEVRRVPIALSHGALNTLRP
jgi:RNA polymerase sigma-70 factor (ECF subfamily)